MIGSTNSIWDINSKFEQLVNYTMLYDGSLGKSGSGGANVCKDLTGGWVNAMSYGTIAYNADSLYSHYAMSGGGESKFKTSNTFDFQEYSLLTSLVTLKSSKTGVRGKMYAGGLSTELLSTELELTKVFMNIKGLEETTTSTTVSVGNMQHTSNSPHLYINIYEVFLTKADDWQTLAEKAGINATSISDILTNSATLLSNKNAVEFMIYRCTGDFMAKAIQSETFLTALNNSQYKTIIMANEHWAKFLGFVA